MIAEVLQKKIAAAPTYIAGLVFSDKSISYVQLEKRQGIWTVAGYGTVTIPYDVVRDKTVMDTIAFTQTVKLLKKYINEEAFISIGSDAPKESLETLQLVGLKNVTVHGSWNYLGYVLVPYGASEPRVAVISYKNRIYISHVSFGKVDIIQEYSVDDFFRVLARHDLEDELQKVENKQILLIDTIPERDMEEYLHEHGFHVSNVQVWQNCIDFTRYIPEMHYIESRNFVWNIALALTPMFAENKKAMKAHPATDIVKTKQSPKAEKKKTKKQEKVGIAGVYGEVAPLSKTAEDIADEQNKEKPLKSFKLTK